MGKPWWEYIQEGKFQLNSSFLLGLGDVPTRKKPLVKSLAGHVLRHGADLSEFGGYTAPLQPITIIVETDGTPEGLVKDWTDTIHGSGGLRLSMTKLYEKFAYSESSSLHGAMLQKIQYQRSQAKDLLGTIQNIKSAIINIESDMEKLGEQIDAFKSSDWGQIKGLFIDNYGGPDRSWTASARHVPIVRLALTWFLRLNVPESVPMEEFFKIKVKEPGDRKKLEELKDEIKEKCNENKKKMLEEVDKAIKEEKMNPALGNYLKRKIEEFWNWVSNYSSWLKTTYDRISENMIQQKANLKMYMKWAADAITNAETMTTHPEDFEFGELTGYFKKYAPSEAMDSEYLFAADSGARPDIWDITKPYVPVIISKVMVFTSMETQNKITDVIIVMWHGYMKDRDYRKAVELAKRGGKSLLDAMINAGAITMEEAEKIFTKEEIEEIKGITREKKESLGDKMVELGELLTKGVSNFFEIFGFSLPKESLPWIRTRRAASYAYTLALQGFNAYKKSHGMLQLPLK